MAMAEIVKKVIDMLPAIGLAIGVTFIVGMFMVIMGGSFEKQAADGNIPVDGNATTGTVKALIDTQADLITVTDTVTDQATTAVNYLPLIVVITIALGFLGYLGFRRFKSGGSSL